MPEQHMGPGEGQSTGGGGHGGSSGRWLVSYADFVTLMFVVFVVLFSMARVDVAKFSALKQSLSGSSIGAPPAGQMTPLPTGGNPINTAPVTPGQDPSSRPGGLNPMNPATAQPATQPPVVTEAPMAVEEPKQEEPVKEPEPAKPTPTPVQTPKPAPDPFGPVSEGFKSTVAARAGQLEVTLNDRGVVVSVLTSVLFLEGQAELKPEATGILDQISSQLKDGSQSVLVEGAPDASSKDAPWDLASRRASAVVSYLVSKHGLTPARFSVIGYGKGAGVDGIVNVVVLRRN